MTTLKELGEREVIRRLARRLPGRGDVRVGVGDDAAVVSPGTGTYDWLLTSDPVIEGVHVETETRGTDIGHKAVGRVFSDLAAMGGEPLWLLLNLVAPGETDIRKIEDLYEGACALAEKYGVAVVGGDTAAGTRLEVHAFAMGRIPKGSALLRSNAKPGDRVYVTGELGGSRTGKHLSFEPRIVEGMWLREQSWPSAMMDVTDGLANDLRRIMEESDVGATVCAADVPISTEARSLSDERSPLGHALFDGEDFELLLTVPEDRSKAFESKWSEAFELSCTRIGRITPDAGTLVCRAEDGVETEIPQDGYEHFKS